MFRIIFISTAIDPPTTDLPKLIFQPQVVSYHGNKLTIGGLSAVVLYCVAKVAVQGIHVPSVPRHLNGVTDGTLHTAGRGGVFLCHRRVEDFGHRVDDVAVLDGEQNGGAEVLVALDVGGDADLVDDLR